ncbi:MAG: hypothetical protein JXX14_22030 [Deltaproteobacteria bacterium]|nr:hypothetical protein [Deltaproteobacteria bacterium]
MKKFFFVLSFICASGLLQSLPAVAEDTVVSFTNARNAFDAGDYQEAASRFEGILEKGLDNEALLIETHKYLGVSYIFLANQKNAEEQFLKLLNLDPDFSLDPLIFPIDVVDFFTSVKQKHALELAEIAAAEARAEEAQKQAEEKRRLEEIERLRTTVYIGKHVKWHSRLVALMPFGAGQFQNGHRRKGLFFLSSELLLLSGCITTFALHESLRSGSRTEFYSEEKRRENEQLEYGFRLANLISVGALGLLGLIGIVDSIYHFEPYTVVWKKIDEKDVPKHLRKKKKTPKAALAPWLMGHSAGIGAVGVF